MDYRRILQILGRKDADVHSVFRCGSRVYGTATASSDEDFVAVLARRDAGRDLLFRDGSNIIVHGLDSFREAIAGQSVFALECLFLAPEHRLKETRPGITFKLDRKKLAESAISRSTWIEIRDNPSDSWEDYLGAYAPVQEGFFKELSALAPRRG